LIPDIPPFAVDRNAPVYCNVQFSNQFTLRGALLTPKNKGLLMELFWQSLAEQPLKYVVFVHLIDQSGKILGQVDYNQYNQAPGGRALPRMAKTGETWRDVVQLSSDKLRA
jgi:hypothetical protein